MALELPQPSFMPCPECGASVPRGEMERHVCEDEQWLDYNVFQLRPELEAFDEQFGAYLQSARGRFEVWYAARRRAA